MISVCIFISTSECQDSWLGGGHFLNALSFLKFIK